jgi:hypothetical protein
MLNVRLMIVQAFFCSCNTDNIEIVGTLYRTINED